MARRKKSKKRSNRLQEFFVLLMSATLILCVASATYGYFVRHSSSTQPPGGLRIEVLNGTGQKGLARQIAMSLMKEGVDVFKVDNADSFAYSETILIARRQGIGLDDFGRALGCKNVIEQLKEDSFVDATLIIGADYRNLRLEHRSDSGLSE